MDFHFFVWNHPEVIFLFSIGGQNENFLLQEVESKVMARFGYYLESPILCEPMNKADRIWEAYVESYQISKGTHQPPHRIFLNSFDLILKGQRGGEVFDDQIHLLTDPMRALNQIKGAKLCAINQCC